MIVDLSIQPKYFKGCNYKNIIKIGDWNNLPEVGTLAEDSFSYGLYDEITKSSARTNLKRICLISDCGTYSRDVFYYSSAVSSFVSQISRSYNLNMAIVL